MLDRPPQDPQPRTPEGSPAPAAPPGSAPARQEAAGQRLPGGDRRRLHGQPDPQGLALLAGCREARLQADLDFARLLVRLDERGACVFAGAASTAELAANLGHDGARARQLLLLGYALRGLPGLEQALRENHVTIAAGVLLGELYVDADTYVEAGEDWLGRARFARQRDLEHAVRRRIAARRQLAAEAQVRTFTAHVGPLTQEDLQACRLLAARKARAGLDNGQLLAVLALAYRLQHDPTATAGGPRRMAPTSAQLEQRGVAAEVARAIHARSGGMCEVGLCERPSVQHCHLRPHREGSAREASDLVGGCSAHHKALDAGQIAFVAWTTDALPVFRVLATGALLPPKPRPEKRPEPERPEWLLRAVGRWPCKPPPRGGSAEAGPTPAAPGQAPPAAASEIDPAARRRDGAPPTRPPNPPPDVVREHARPPPPRGARQGPQPRVYASLADPPPVVRCTDGLGPWEGGATRVP